MTRRRLAIASAAVALASLAAVIGVVAATGTSVASVARPSSRALVGIHKIRHVIVIMQENRSFDSYFGTYPGSGRNPDDERRLTVCLPDPTTGGCVAPFHDPADATAVGRHAAAADRRHQRREDGRVRRAGGGGLARLPGPEQPGLRATPGHADVMGYHDGHEIPNYWTYAKTSCCRTTCSSRTRRGACPAHLFMVSEWSARCTYGGSDELHELAAARSAEAAGRLRCIRTAEPPEYAWTDLTYLLHKHQRELGAITCSTGPSPTARPHR